MVRRGALVPMGRGTVGAKIVGLGKCLGVDPKRRWGDFWDQSWGYYPTCYTVVGVGERTSEGAPPRRMSEVRVGTKCIKRVIEETLDLLRGISPNLFD